MLCTAFQFFQSSKFIHVYQHGMWGSAWQHLMIATLAGMVCVTWTLTAGEMVGRYACGHVHCMYVRILLQILHVQHMNHHLLKCYSPLSGVEYRAASGQPFHSVSSHNMPRAAPHPKSLCMGMAVLMRLLHSHSTLPVIVVVNKQTTTDHKIVLQYYFFIASACLPQE